MAPQLPPKIITREYCPLTETQKRLYSEAVDKNMASIANSSGIARGSAWRPDETETDCRSATSWTGILPSAADSSKFTRLAELIQEIKDSGEKALVFSQYLDAATIAKYIACAVCQWPIELLDGGARLKSGNGFVNAFRRRGRIPRTFW